MSGLATNRGALSRRLTHLLGSLRRPPTAWTIVYWLGLLAASFVLVLPLWSSMMPPLTDFGGHFQMADAVARYDESAIFSQHLEVVDDWLSPNLLAVRIVDWLYPLFDTLFGMRVVYSLFVVATIAGAVYALREFERSRWLIFLVMPFVWGGMLAMGTVCYVGAIALMLFAIGLARRSAIQGGWRNAVKMGILGLVAFWMHGMGFVITVALILGISAVSLRRARNLLVTLSLLPAAALWVSWFTSAQTESANTGELLTEAVGKTTNPPLLDRLSSLLQEAMDVTTSDLDLTLLVLFGLVWLLLMSQRQPREAEDPVPGRSASARAARRVKRWADEHALLLLAMALLAGLMLLPGRVQDIAISSRLATPFALIVMMLPRLPKRSVPVAVGVATAFAGTLIYGIHLTNSMIRFDERELVPIAQLLEAVPEHKRVRCVATGRPQVEFLRRPVYHACHGMAQYQRGAFAGGGFSHTGFNAVRNKDPEFITMTRSRDWQRLSWLRHWDYLLVRGKRNHASTKQVQLVKKIEQKGGETWFLYQVVSFRPRSNSLSHYEGGKGGRATLWNCTERKAVSSLAISTARGYVANVVLACHELSRDNNGKLRLAGKRQQSPPIGGTGKRQREQKCPPGSSFIGVKGVYKWVITDLRPLCGDPYAAPAKAKAKTKTETKTTKEGSELPDKGEAPKSDSESPGKGEAPKSDSKPSREASMDPKSESEPSEKASEGPKGRKILPDGTSEAPKGEKNSPEKVSERPKDSSKLPKKGSEGPKEGSKLPGKGSKGPKEGSEPPKEGPPGAKKPVIPTKVKAAPKGKEKGKDKPTKDHKTFEIRCPVGSIVTGFTGRVAKYVDAAGIICSPIEDILKESAEPAAKPKPKPPAAKLKPVSRDRSKRVKPQGPKGKAKTKPAARPKTPRPTRPGATKAPPERPSPPLLGPRRSIRTPAAIPGRPKSPKPPAKPPRRPTPKTPKGETKPAK